MELKLKNQGEKLDAFKANVNERLLKLLGLMDSRINASTHLNSAFVVEAGSGKEPSFSYFSSHFLPSWMSMVASPPSSTIKSGPSLPGHVSICSVHHQYSSSVSPFHANTDEVPALAIAAAAWSWVDSDYFAAFWQVFIIYFGLL